MLSKDQWQNNYELIDENFHAGQLDIEGVKDSLRALGFDQNEISDYVSVLQELEKG